MFFTQDQINDDITCQRCKHLFVDPRCLPCGDCLCFSCIESDDKCFFCEQVHSVPKDGFPISKTIVNLLKKKPMFKFTLFDEFKNKLDEFKSSLDSFNSKIEMSSETLKDHCDFVRNVVEVKTESLIQKIEKNKELLLKQIDNYETECQMRMKNEKQNIDSNYQKYSNFINEYNNYINNEQVDKTNISKVKTNLLEKRLLLLRTINDFNYIIFNGQKIKFIEYENDSINEYNIGRFTFEPIEISFQFFIDYRQGFNSLFDKKWFCGSCLAQNLNSISKCICCSAQRPFSSDSIKPLGLDMVLSAATNKWTCTSCLVSNDSDKTTCICCSTSKLDSILETAKKRINSSSFIPLTGSNDKVKNGSFLFGTSPKSNTNEEEEKAKTTFNTKKPFTFSQIPLFDSKITPQLQQPPITSTIVTTTIEASKKDSVQTINNSKQQSTISSGSKNDTTADTTEVPTSTPTPTPPTTTTTRTKNFC
jgi:hypothetical protein